MARLPTLYVRVRYDLAAAALAAIRDFARPIGRNECRESLRGKLDAIHELAAQALERAEVEQHDPGETVVERPAGTKTSARR
jgi:hypothetical protein